VSTAQDPKPGGYREHRHIIDDPNLREAFLVQVRGTVQGLRSAYRWHAIIALGAIAFLIIARPGGWVQDYRGFLILGALAIDLIALAGLRSAAATPARYVVPLLVADAIVILLLVLAAIRHDAFNLAWLLLLVMPIMLLVYWRDARAIAPVLAEHADWRKGREDGDLPKA